MRHTWHADQETTVLLHFCHHLPTDFFHIPIWMGGLGSLSISSPLTVSQQKAPLVRFLLQQLIAPRGVFWLRLQRTPAVPGLDLYGSHGSIASAAPPAKQRIVRIPRPGNDEHSVKSAAQITNFNSLQSLLLICVLLGEALCEGYVTACVGQMKGSCSLWAAAGRSAAEAWALRAPPTTMH